MGNFPFGGTPALQLQAATPVAGTALVNGTPTILSWTAPNDGKLHRVIAFASLLVTVNETGGQVNLSGTLPSPGGAFNDPLFSANQAAGSQISFCPGGVVAPGSTVTVNQASALTVGAAVLYAEIWGA